MTEYINFGLPDLVTVYHGYRKDCLNNNVAKAKEMCFRFLGQISRVGKSKTFFLFLFFLEQEEDRVLSTKVATKRV